MIVSDADQPGLVGGNLCYFRDAHPCLLTGDPS